tara:strand:- start:3499 stop:4530 length:1032 start_codon:yes stop_codon:yes gene_type:complete
MKFPLKYRCLELSELKNGDYKLIPIRFSHRKLIMKWRNEQIYHLRQSKVLTPDMQNEYFKNDVKSFFFKDKPKNILFSFLLNERLIGYGGLVHINWVKKNAEISFIMNTKLEKDNFKILWFQFLNLLRDVSFNYLNLEKIYTYAYDLRPNVIGVFNDYGMTLEKILKNHKLKDCSTTNVYIHSINNNVSFRKINKSDKRILFNWFNDEQTRKNSFVNKRVSYQEHSKWFNNNITNKFFLGYMFYFKNVKAGFVRFTIYNDDATIGINLNPKFRGKKLSKIFLVQSTNDLFKRSSINNIIAHIKSDNIPSIKSFEGAGFIKLISSSSKTNDSRKFILRKNYAKK